MPITTQHKDLTGADLHNNKVYPETNTELSADSLAVLDARFGAQSVSNAVPTGAVNGLNTTFTAPSAFVLGTTKVYLNGLRQLLDGDYTEATNTTISFVDAPQVGDVLVMDYDRDMG